MITDGNNEPLVIADGIGGRIVLYRDHIKITKAGVVATLLDLIGTEAARVEVVIPLDRVSVFRIVSPLFLLQFIAISYPGGEPLTGHYWKDALSDTSLIMNFVDNRKFRDLTRRLEALLSNRKGMADDVSAPDG
jgi:hypothetical protein